MAQWLRSISAPAQRTKAFPTVYKLNEGIPVAGANGLLTLTGTMRAVDVTHGTLKVTFKEVRVAGAQQQLGGSMLSAADHASVAS